MVMALAGKHGLEAEVEALFRIACRLTGNRHDAEDLVQDVCERALSRAPEFAAAEDCRRWLLRVLYNRFIDGRRGRQRAAALAARQASAEAEPAVEAADPEALAAQQDAETVLGRAWTRLEPAQQMLLMLRAEGYDLGEIAAVTDLDKPALSSRLHRARASLAKYLDEEESAQPRCAIAERRR